MIRKFSSIIFFIFTIILLSCTESGKGYELSAALSTNIFYSKPEQIIQQIEKNSSNCQKNFILAKAYKSRKELKNALLYYVNSCFNKKYNFNIRLFPQPVYAFVESSNEKSIFYQDSVFEIASIFYEYGEHQYVLKFTDLVGRDESALYRETVLLRSKSLQKLNRFKESIDELQKIQSSYSDPDSLSLIHLRLGAVYESAGDFYKASDSYINVVKAGSGVWQNGIAAKRLIFLTTDKKVTIDSVKDNLYYASALYDAENYDRALAVADAVLKKEKSPPAEIIKIKVLTLKSYSKAAPFLKEMEKTPGYSELLLEHANILWENGKKYEAVKCYEKLSAVPDKKILERILTRLAFYYEERNRPEFIKFMELYEKNFPDDPMSGRFVWLTGRYYIKTSNKTKAVEYLNRGIKNYPDNVYTSYCRFWLHKLSAKDSSAAMSEDLLEELAADNPDSYHTLTTLKKTADNSETSALEKKFEESSGGKDMKKMQLYHSLLFIKNGYDRPYYERIKKFDPVLTGNYTALAELIKNPSFSGPYRQLMKKIETYFYAGDIDSINREIKLIPEENIDAQKDLALALTVYSQKYRYYNYSTFYGFRLLKLYNLRENISVTPKVFAEALYPYAFSECVKEEGKNFKIEPELILAMMKIESNFNYDAVSPAGASGLMQLMYPTAAGIARELRIAKFDLADPCTSIKFGADYLAWLNRYYKGQIEYMVAGYNAGAGNVDKWKGKGTNQDIDRFSEFTPFDETRDYIFRTKKYLIQYESIYKNSVN